VPEARFVPSGDNKKNAENGNRIPIVYQVKSLCYIL